MREPVKCMQKIQRGERKDRYTVYIKDRYREKYTLHQISIKTNVILFLLLNIYIQVNNIFKIYFILLSVFNSFVFICNT